MASRVEKVFVVPFCRRAELLYGTTLVFETIRTGFPDAEITVLDNGSVQTVRKKIEALSRSIEASFHQLENSLPHHDILKFFLNSTDCPFAVVDPDVIFWERFDMVSNSLLEGRLIPKFVDPFSKCLTHERLHTSMLKFPDPGLLRKTITEIQTQYFEWCPFTPIMVPNEGQWERFDTSATLWSAIKEHSHQFSTNELDFYDHLFCGSHLDLVANNLGGWAAEFVKVHDLVRRGEFLQLKGIWREQEEFFATFGPY